MSALFPFHEGSLREGGSVCHWQVALGLLNWAQVAPVWDPLLWSLLALSLTYLGLNPGSANP